MVAPTISESKMVAGMVADSAGQILKAASWNTPAKGPRGSIYDAPGARPLTLSSLYR